MLISFGQKLDHLAHLKRSEEKVRGKGNTANPCLFQARSTFGRKYSPEESYARL
jgi:hypothetical protein